VATFSTGHTKVVQSARREHHVVREALDQIAQDIFDDSTDLHTSQRMFATHANPGQALIGAFLRQRQFTAARLFFG